MSSRGNKRKRTNSDKKEVSKKQKKNSRKESKSKGTKSKGTKSKETSPIIKIQPPMSQPKSKPIPKSTQSSSTTASSSSSGRSSLSQPIPKSTQSSSTTTSSSSSGRPSLSQTFVPYDSASFSTTPSISQPPSLLEPNMHRRATTSQSQVESSSGSAQTTQIQSSYEESEEPLPKDFKNGASTSHTLNSMKKSRQSKGLSTARITVIILFILSVVGLLYVSWSAVVSAGPPDSLPVHFQLPPSCPNANSTKKWNVKHIHSTLSKNLPNHKNAVDQSAKSLASLLNGHSERTTVLHFFGSNHDAKKILLKNVKTLLYAENLDHIAEFSQKELKDASSLSDVTGEALAKLKDRVIEKLKLCNTSLFIINGTKDGREAMYEFEGFFDRSHYQTGDKQKLKLTSALFILLSDVNEEGDRDDNIRTFFNRPAFVGRILHNINFS